MDIQTFLTDVIKPMVHESLAAISAKLDTMIATHIDISHRLDATTAAVVDNSDTIDNLNRLLFKSHNEWMLIAENLQKLQKRCERDWLDDDE